MKTFSLLLASVAMLAFSAYSSEGDRADEDVVEQDEEALRKSCPKPTVAGTAILIGKGNDSISGGDGADHLSGLFGADCIEGGDASTSRFAKWGA